MTGADNDNPYVGMRAYDTGDRFRFFGRYLESHEVVSLWLGNRLLVLHGSSGVGKTSLVRAGVLPLVGDDAEVLPLGRIVHGSAFPTAALREHNPYTFALLSSWSLGDLPTRLSGLSVLDFLRERGERKDRYGDRLPLLVAIDQFEELFSDFPHRWTYRDEFIKGLATALENLPHLRLLISVREDFLAALLPYEPAIARSSRARLRLLPLARNAALDAVRRPLEPTERAFTPGAAEELVDNLQTIQRVDNLGQKTRFPAERIEPVQLQVVCSALWQGLPPDVREITTEHLRDYGDVDRTLADFCDDMVGEVAGDHDIPAHELREWLRRTFITELGTRGTAYEGFSATGGMSNAVARALEYRHILRVEQRSGSRWYELQHDRLIEPVRQVDRPGSAAGGTASEANAADYLRAAESALVDGELTLAEKHAEEALRACGDNDGRTGAETESFLGNIALQRGQPEEAERRYRRAAGLFATLPDETAVGRLLAAIGKLLLDRGRYAEAVEGGQGAVARLPGDLTVRVELARALSYAGQPWAAVAVYGTVLTVAPESAEALSGRGQVRADLGDHRSALADLDRLLVLHPDYGGHADVRSARGLALAVAGLAEEAAADLSDALLTAPDNGIVLLRAAKAARASGDHARARDLASQALTAHERPLLPHQAAEAQRILRASPDGGGSAP